MKPTLILGVLAAAVPTLVNAEDSGITAFNFDTLASRSATFDRTAYLYPAEHDLAGQVNANTGDVRLDGVVIDGTSYTPAQLQLVSTAKIVLDDAIDAERGGGNLTAGHGIGADLDPLTAEGTGSTTPTPEILAAAQGNYNLSSIIAVRENVGTASYELAFKQTDTMLVWERGNSGDVQVEAIDDAGKVVGSLLVLDGADDGNAKSTYTPTGVFVTTYVQDGFLNQGQQLSSVGLKLDQPVKTLRFTAQQEAEGDGAVRYNGPDLKVLALAP